MNTKMLILLLILALAVPAMAVDLNGTWYTGSNNGTPYLSSTTSNSFTWGQGEQPEFTTATKGSLWSYFPDLTLAKPGDRITLEFSAVINDGGTGQDIRFGLFNDGGNRVLTNLEANNDSGFTSTLGYWTTWPAMPNNSASLRGRIVGLTNPVSGNNSIVFHSSTGNPGLPEGSTCHFTFSILVVNDTEYQFTSTMDNGTDTKTMTATTTVTDTKTFNTFFMLNTQTYIGSFTFSGMKVTYNDWAWDPYPAPGAVDIELDPTLSWSTGLDPNVPTQANANITKHLLYGNFADPTDPNLFLIAELPVGTTTYDLSGLQLETTYRWRVDELVIDPVTSDPCAITGMEWSFDTILSTPSITEQPQDMVVAEGEEVLLNVAATNPFYGDATGLSYQWKYSPDGVTYSDVTTGGNSATLTLSPVQISDQGYYYCDVTIVSNNQTVSSEIALLIVKQLLAYWTMDQADYVNGQYLDIVAGHNADPNSPPTFVAGAGPDAPAAGAATIAPDSQAPVGTWNPVETTGQVTLSAWIKWDGSALGTYGQDILIKQDSWGTDTMMWSFRLRSVDSDGNAGIRFYNASGMNIWPRGVVQPNTWTHICAVYGSGQAQLYINGRLSGSDGTAALGTGIESQLTIGGNSIFPGALDNVMIHNYAMDAEDAAALYYETSKEAVCLYPPATDLNNDCKTNLQDIAIFAMDWLNCGLVPDCLQ